jgi:CRISPR-associated protein Csm1
MSLQVFLQAQLLGAEGFLAYVHFGGSETANDLLGRCAWLSLLGEVLPRALLAELGLSRMLLGSSSAEQFLLVLAEEDIARANDFLARAANSIARLSANTLRLIWSSTENLGAWPIVRKRLDDGLAAKTRCPLPAGDPGDLFAPFGERSSMQTQSSFAEFAEGLVSAASVGWSAESPLLLTWQAGAHNWPLREHSSIEQDGILFPRRFAMDDEHAAPATLQDVAERAGGADRWGILRGDVDHFELQLRRAASVEEHIHFSALFKEFFAGELAVLCAMPDFWRKVTILYRGGDDFAVSGSWDALIQLGRELERVFEKFVEKQVASLPGIEAKSISMALAIAPELASSATAVFAEAGAELRAAKSVELGSFYLFGRSLEWKRLSDAEELKSSLVRLVRDHCYPAEYLNDLASVYRESFSARAGRRSKAIRADRRWRTYLRLSRVIPQPRGKEQNNLRNAIITNLMAKRTAGVKLRPAARVALEWARLAASA